jgi:hypothetical protein
MVAPKKTRAATAKVADQKAQRSGQPDRGRAAKHARIDFDALRKSIIRRFPKTLARLAE